MAAAILAILGTGPARPASAASWSRFETPGAAASPEGRAAIQASAESDADDAGEERSIDGAGIDSTGEDGQDDSDRASAPDGCSEEAGACREALLGLRQDTLSSIDLDIRVGGRPGNDYPCECRLEGETFEPRRFAKTTFTWKAAGYCHKPLYFEQWNLERHGHSYGFVPDFFLSGAHFFVTLPILPYKMGVELPWECVYPLGHYRPGGCAPWTCPPVPISGRGLAVQAATITGVVFLLP